MSPKVFVSHASEDKERFVLAFATKLYTKGIEAWVDKWEMLPGDSLVDKIFEAGIPNAEAVIVVVSEHSVNKPWVREELNLGVVRRINGDSKLIPVVIGKINERQIPEVLKSTVWERINDLNSYDAELARIIGQIYGHYEKPPLGPPPDYVQAQTDTISNLTTMDSLILKMSCEELIQTGGHRLSLVQPKLPESIYELAESMDIYPSTVLESLQILDSRGYISAGGFFGEDIPYFTVTDFGFQEYGKACLPDYDLLFRYVALQIVNHKKQGSEEIAEALAQPQIIVEHIITKFANQNYVKVWEANEGRIHILETHPKLRRWLQETS